MIAITYGRHHLWLSPLMIVYMDGCFMDDCHLTVWRGLTRHLLSLSPPLVLVVTPQLSGQDQGAWRCSLPLSLSMLFYCSSFNSFSLTLCTFKHRKGICTYLSSYLPRLHNKLDYVRLSRNLYIDYVRLSINLHVHYVRLSRSLYVHYVRLRPTYIYYT